MQGGNPVLSPAVSDYKAGYAKKLDELGYAPVSAKHLEHSKYVLLMKQEAAAVMSLRAQVS